MTAVDKEKLRKIQRLADSNAPESASARAILDKLLHQAGLTESDLQEEIARCWFSYRNKTEELLIYQVAWLVTGKRNPQRWGLANGTKRVGIDVPLHLEERMATETKRYLKLWRSYLREYERKALSAFVNKHKIWGPHEPTASDLSQDEIRDLLNLMRDMPDAPASESRQIETVSLLDDGRPL